MRRRLHLERRISWLALGILTAAVAAVYVEVQAAAPMDGAVYALFDLTDPAAGPFPSDTFTVADADQNTGLRVNLPMPDCTARPSDCQDLEVINTLDGFNLQPRLSIPFDGPVDVTTVNSRTVFLIRLGDTLAPSHRGGKVVGVDQVVWDRATKSLHVESNELLDQHTRYALVATNGLLDLEGRSVRPSEAFKRFRHNLNYGQTDDPRSKAYREALLETLKAARAGGVEESEIICASVFTTQSATADLEKIRDQIKAAVPDPADFNLAPGRERTVFRRDEVSGITFNRQTRVTGPLNPVPVAINLLDIIPGAVETIAFGKYRSPDYEVHPGDFIPPAASRTGIPQAQGSNEIHFNLFLPSGAKPAGGWPVVIYGHGGLPNNKNTTVFNVAAMMAAHGLATISISVVGSGSGPLSTLTVRPTVGDPVTFIDGGRGHDQNGDGVITDNEGILAIPPRTLIDRRDGIRQTVVDLMQLTRVIEVGLDVDGDGVADLDASQIAYFGQSLGGTYGTILLAVEPDIRAGVLGGAGGPVIDGFRLGGSGNRSSPVGGRFLALRTPSLINGPGITTLDGVPTGPPYFNENQPLRNGASISVELEGGTTGIIRSPVVNTVTGAMEIQELFDRFQWVAQSGDAVAFARHLQRSPLPGVPGKSVLFLFAKGDMTVPNPTTTAILRAGALAHRTTFFRNDLAVAEDPTVSRNPHGFAFAIADPSALARQIALGAQEQIALFLASHGELLVHAEPERFFEVPIVLPLPEGLSYIR